MHVLRVSCKDMPGLDSVISKAIFVAGYNIYSLQQHVDSFYNHFFVHAVFTGDKDNAELERYIRSTIDDPELSVTLSTLEKKKLVLLVTKDHHCLSELLINNYVNTHNYTVCAVFSNRNDLQDLTDRFGIPFYYIPVIEGEAREKHEQRLLEKIEAFTPDYLILARYMRILTPFFVNKYKEKAINIHHSFLPAFIGANPYKQAYDRGVKIIGATAHFVTEDLDEGPIITQEVTRVDQRHSWQQMREVGRNIETVTLSKAIDAVCDERVIVYKNRTVVF